DVVDKSTDPQVQARWNELKAQWAAGNDPLAPYRSALGTGNAWRGSRVFQEHPVLACIRCHRVNGYGGEAGPDLTLIGAQKSPEYLLESVVKPNAKIAQGFDIVTLKLKDGSYESGALMSESVHEIVLKRSDGSEAKIDPASVVERQAAPSAMPEIYSQVLTRSELRDLITYLRTLTVAEPSMGEHARATSGTTAASHSGGHAHEEEHAGAHRSALAARLAAARRPIGAAHILHTDLLGARCAYAAELRARNLFRSRGIKSVLSGVGRRTGCRGWPAMLHETF